VQQKTIVGAILGGWAAVELSSPAPACARAAATCSPCRWRWASRSARIGCFLHRARRSDLSDATSRCRGASTSATASRAIRWQLYESAFGFALGVRARADAGPAARAGIVFRAFLVGYFGFRALIDVPQARADLRRLTTLQWVVAADLRRRAGERAPARGARNAWSA
jgi:hypothetical protein